MTYDGKTITGDIAIGVVETLNKPHGKITHNQR